MREKESQVNRVTLLDLIKILNPNTALLSEAMKQKYSGIQIINLFLDSRKVKEGSAFFAVAGAQVDGRRYINEAISNGANVVFVDDHSITELSIKECDGAQIVAVNKLPEKMSAIAGFFYRSPSQYMHLIGITGTNGKTTCAYLFAQLMSELGVKTGLLGTLGCGALPVKCINSYDENSEKHAEDTSGFEATGFTTPDALASQRYLAKLARLGCQKVVMEVSSHGLVQHRVAALSFDTAVFTNLSRDHLDFHQSMEAYAEAKRQLFEFPDVSSAVINVDDVYGQQLAASLPNITKIIRYSITNSSADIYAKNIHYSMQGVDADIVHFNEEARLSTRLIGDFNLSNVLAVIATASLQGIKIEDSVAAFKAIKTVTGRMQSVLLDDITHAEQVDIGVIVDFAHTPDALKVALLALRKHSDGTLICVFGCGGNRDKGKRPLMGAVAEQLADKVYLTSDNPRDEQPEGIVRDVLHGMKNTSSAIVELDRAKAIAAAVGEAQAGSVVLVAGKGHEDYQLINGYRHAFNDYDAAKHALIQRCAA